MIVDHRGIVLRFWRIAQHRFRSLFRRRAEDEELEREMALHLEQLAREGSAAEAARRFGPALSLKEQCRDARRVNWIEDLAKDTRHGLRLLRKSPGFTCAAILSLALGLGANTAIFSLVDTVLLRELPVERPRELVFIQAVGNQSRGGSPPYPCFERIRTETTAFAGIAAFASDEVRVEIDGNAEQAFGQVASGNYFDVLGLKPAAGRLLTVADEKLNPPVVVISHGYWQRRFGGDPSAIGRSLVSNKRTYTIAGVTPRDFHGLQPGRQVDVTMPINVEGALLNNADSWWFDAIARLRPGVDAGQARVQADTVFRSFMKDSTLSSELQRMHFDHIELGTAAQGLDRLRQRFSKPLLALTLVAALVLLIGCANLSNLMLARGTARTREFSIRLAAGAGAGRLFRQLLTETMLLFVFGSAVGLGVAIVSARGLAGFFAVGRSPILLDVALDWRVAAYASGVALAAGLLTGLWPAMQALRLDPQRGIREGKVRMGAVAPVLVGGQVAVSLVLVIGAALFARTMYNLQSADLGFRSTRVMTMSLLPQFSEDKSGVLRQRFLRTVAERVRTLPGVHAASVSVLTPLSGRDTGKRVEVAGFQPRSEQDRTIRVNHVSEDYFDTFGIAIRDGRAIAAADVQGAPKVAVINEAAAKFYFAGRSPIGETLSFNGNVLRIVGVGSDHKHRSVREEAPRMAFVSVWQPLDPIGRTTLSVSSDLPGPAVMRAVRGEVQGVHSDTLISDVLGVEEQIAATQVSERLLSILATAFAALALLLAAVGLYGILSHTVAQRRVEFGVRMALGARWTHVAWAVLRPMMLQVGIGIAAGLAMAMALARLAGTLLYGVTADDSEAYVVSTAVLVLVACVAAATPARRAWSIDPAEALRSE